MCSASQGSAYILGKCPDIRALGTGHFECKAVIANALQSKFVNFYPARFALNLLALARQLIKPLTLVLEGGIHRWNLLDLTNKTSRVRLI